jgi:hypothetical protein
MCGCKVQIRLPKVQFNHIQNVVLAHAREVHSVFQTGSVHENHIVGT